MPRRPASRPGSPLGRWWGIRSCRRCTTRRSRRCRPQPGRRARSPRRRLCARRRRRDRSVRRPSSTIRVSPAGGGAHAPPVLNQGGGAAPGQIAPPALQHEPGAVSQGAVPRAPPVLNQGGGNRRRVRSLHRRSSTSRVSSARGRCACAARAQSRVAAARRRRRSAISRSSSTPHPARRSSRRHRRPPSTRRPPSRQWCTRRLRRHRS